MRILVISDIHGNLPALEFVLNKERSADKIISLGDVVNYGPWSNECVDLMDTLTNKILIVGNHEEAFISGKYKGENLIAKTFFQTCFPTFTKRGSIIKYIEKFSIENTDFVHTINNNYIFSDSDVKINTDTFIGHSHRMFSKNIENYRLVNVGSVGQNRTNIDKVNYVIWDTEKNSVELVEIDFLANQLINEMKAKKFPELCINYILSKRKNL